MSHRAAILRVKDGELWYGQTKYGAYDNAKILNEHWKDPEKIEALFERLCFGKSTEEFDLGNGISSLGKDMESTDWYEDSYNCGIRALPFRDGKDIATWGSRLFDWAEHWTVWGVVPNEWLDASASNDEAFADLCNKIYQALNK